MDKSFGTKEPFELFPSPILLRKLISFVDLENNPRRSELVDILTFHLASENHIRLQGEGLSILMIWLEKERPKEGDLVTLYKNMITVNEKSSRQTKIEYSQPLSLIQSGLSRQEESYELLSELLYLMTWEYSKSDELEYFFNLLRVFYLTFYFPKVKSQKSKYECPANVLLLFVRHFSMWLTQDMSLLPSLDKHYKRSTLLPNAAFILSEIISLSEINTQYAHEIVRCSLTSPFSEKETLLNAMHIINTLSFSSVTRSNELVQKFIGYHFLIFDGRPSAEYASEQFECYLVSIKYFKSIASQSVLVLCKETWNLLLEKMLNICESHFCPTNKYSMIYSHEFAENFSEVFFQCLYSVWIRSKSNTEEWWQKLCKCLSKTVHWKASINQWCNVLDELTKVLAQHLYGFAFDQEYGKVVTFDLRKSRSVLIKSQSNDTQRTLPHSLSEPMSVTKLNEYSQWFDLDWTKSNAEFLWHNVLRVIGDINEISNPELHSIAMKCVVSNWDILSCIRESQDFESEKIPPVYDIVPWLLKTNELPE